MLVATANAATITDCCDWSTAAWSYSSFGFGVGTATATREASGGNPGARLNVTTVTPASPDTAYATAVYQNFIAPAPLSGSAFSLSLDVLSGPGGFGQGQAIQLLVEQGGTVYGTFLAGTGWPINTFTPLTFPGTFNAAAFTRIFGAGPSVPAFDGVTPTRFGFAAGNNMSATLTQYYDNFSLVIATPAIVAPAAAIPTLSQWSIALLAVLVAFATLLWHPLRRRL